MGKTPNQNGRTVDVEKRMQGLWMEAEIYDALTSEWQAATTCLPEYENIDEGEWRRFIDAVFTRLEQGGREAPDGRQAEGDSGAGEDRI